ncbi:hypothetical protein BU26DRAFT_258690 [Trematosphaeria pertusa]|uniref:Uncharacterized protein n=1 Tax=Trematosphaeria pertusa TaxID=390896 RepID=A0A6A6IQ14_9PLEO|nr:uncharacterized protein BU26DRAFT_258690 [Trematosphaeria pertusa]KAF2252551.1 hypothetical protein BU26DRAFT_258690 [Trematosphaeria pertusa]
MKTTMYSATVKQEATLPDQPLESNFALSESEIIYLSLGEEYTLTVPQNLLLSSSEFSKKATESEWASSSPDPDTIILSDDFLPIVET